MGRQLYWVMKGHLDNGKTYLYAMSYCGHRGAKDHRVGVDCIAAKVVLRQPYNVVTQRVGQLSFLKGAVYNLAV